MCIRDSIFGVNRGSITYTAGSLITTGQGLRVNSCSIVGFGSGGISLPFLYVNSTLTSFAGAAITLTDTVPLSVNQMFFDGFTGNVTFAFAGNIGFIAANLTFQQAGGTQTGLGLANNVTYTVTNSFIFRAQTSLNPSNGMSSLNGSTPVAFFILSPGASQDVFGMAGRFINSAAGQTIWTRKGLLVTTTNWNLWTYPRTRFSSFTS